MTASALTPSVVVFAETADLISATQKAGCTHPRNLVALAGRVADRWQVVLEGPADGCAWLALALTSRLRLTAGTAEFRLRCVWQANGKGGYRWEGATLSRNGEALRGAFAWGDVGPWIERADAVLVDPATEATGATYQGRTPMDWSALADQRAQEAALAHARGRAVRDRLARAGTRTSGDAPGTGPVAAAWVAIAHLATRAPFRRIERRAVTARSIAGAVQSEIARGADGGRSLPARRAFDLAERARLLAQACTADASAMEAAALDAQAAAQCAAYLEPITAAMGAEESAWAAANPTGGALGFARSVLQTIGNADVRFAQWWEHHRTETAGMTFFQAWDAWRPGQQPHAEIRAALRLSEEIDGAIFAAGADMASRLRHTDDVEQRAWGVELAEAAAAGAAVGAPGSRRDHRAAARMAAQTWSLMAGPGRQGWGLSLDMAENIAALDHRIVDTRQLELLFLAKHGLALRERAHATVREELKAKEEQRAAVGRAAYEGALASGEAEGSAREAAADARARAEADDAGRPGDGRDRFLRGEMVWVSPPPGSNADRWVAKVLGYTPGGVFRLAGEGTGAPTEAGADRLAPATEAEAAPERVRQQRERLESDARRARLAAVARGREQAAEAERRAGRERVEARAAGAADAGGAPVTAGRVWDPVYRVPASVAQLWTAAARKGWRMTRHTAGSGDSSAIVVDIAGTTGHGRWQFRLVWTVSRGWYSVGKQASSARWADGRTGPRGGRIDPTISDVLSVLYEETVEGVRAPFGQLVGQDAAPVAANAVDTATAGGEQRAD